MSNNVQPGDLFLFTSKELFLVTRWNDTVSTWEMRLLSDMSTCKTEDENMLTRSILYQRLT